MMAAATQMFGLFYSKKKPQDDETLILDLRDINTAEKKEPKKTKPAPTRKRKKEIVKM